MLRRMQRTTVLTGGILMLGGIAAWTLGNFVFFVLAARRVGPEDFGLVAALLAVVVGALVPCGGIQAGIARIVASGTDSQGFVRASFARVSMLSIVALAVIGAGIVVVESASADAVPAVLLLLTSVALVVLVPFHMLLGALQGRHRFAATATCLAVLGVSRPLAFLLFDTALSSSTAAVAASTASVIAALLVAAGLARVDLVFSGTAPPASRTGLARVFGAPVVALTGIGALVNADVVAAKLTLPDVDAGLFGALAPLGRTGVMIVPMAVSFVLLPRVAAARGANRPTLEFLGLGVVATALVGIVLVAIAEPVSFLVPAVFGDRYSAADQLLLPIMAAGVPLALVVVVVNHAIALNRRRLLLAFGAMGPVVVALFALWHGSSGRLLMADALCAVLFLVLHDWLGRGDDTILGGVRAILRRVVQRGVTERPTT